jgi:hypothetical protein
MRPELVRGPETDYARDCTILYGYAEAQLVHVVPKADGLVAISLASHLRFLLGSVC